MTPTKINFESGEIATPAGKFPTADLEKFILGEGDIKAAHGSADMPVWGPLFRRVEKDQDLGLVRARRVVEYIQTLQGR